MTHKRNLKLKIKLSLFLAASGVSEILLQIAHLYIFKTVKEATSLEFEIGGSEVRCWEYVLMRRISFIWWFLREWLEVRRVEVSECESGEFGALVCFDTGWIACFSVV